MWYPPDRSGDRCGRYCRCADASYLSDSANAREQQRPAYRIPPCFTPVHLTLANLIPVGCRIQARSANEPDSRPNERPRGLARGVGYICWVVLSVDVAVLTGRIAERPRERVPADEPARGRVVVAGPQVLVAQGGVVLLAGEAVLGAPRARAGTRGAEDIAAARYLPPTERLPPNPGPSY